MKKALIAMSGGVDSSVAAYLIKEQGMECIGATMRLYSNEDIQIDSKTCCSLDDVLDAKAVAHKMGINHYVFNFSDNFRSEVIERFISEYEAGLTPNPCIDCNRYIKWQKMFTRMKELELDYVVTGHYARIEYDAEKNRYLLKKGIDETKDQSYVLYNMTQEQLAHTLLPLGKLKKSEVRRIAEEQGFVNSKKKDSQDICFVPNGDYAAFIEGYTGKTYPEGDFIRKDGKILGKHKGLIRYTIGQRKGLGLALDRPGYVCKKDMEHNAVIIGDNEDLFTRRLIADDFNWIAIEVPSEPIKIKAKTRYKHREQSAVATRLPDGRVEVVFDEPQRAITSGQAVVLYDGDTVVGGGKITETEYNI